MHYRYGIDSSSNTYVRKEIKSTKLEWKEWFDFTANVCYIPLDGVGEVEKDGQKVWDSQSLLRPLKSAERSQHRTQHQGEANVVIHLYKRILWWYFDLFDWTVELLFWENRGVWTEFRLKNTDQYGVLKVCETNQSIVLQPTICWIWGNVIPGK